MLTEIDVVNRYVVRGTDARGNVLRGGAPPMDFAAACRLVFRLEGSGCAVRIYPEGSDVPVMTHAEALAASDLLRRIVAAWRENRFGAIDSPLIEEAENLLGLDPEADPLDASAAEPAS